MVGSVADQNTMFAEVYRIQDNPTSCFRFTLRAIPVSEVVLPPGASFDLLASDVGVGVLKFTTAITA